MDLHVYSTLLREVVPFRPLDPSRVKVYTCGPTVYRFAHIGNLRTYLMSDILVRVLGYLSYDVYHVKNITDVGHMRQEMLEREEDKVIAAARAAKKTPEEIATFFTEAFLRDEKRMNLVPADLYPRASDHIPEMIDLVQKLFDKGFTYEREGIIYFDIGKFDEYGMLSRNIPEKLHEGHRGHVDHHKKHPEDFTLWKRAEPGRELKWESPWGEGFPGWHIECSAMALKYLGEEFDFHLGGIDLVFPHHENEIAQARCATGGNFARYWIHGGHLLVDGKKMSKSARNEYTLDDLEKHNISPIDFRYLCLNAHYGTVMNYTIQAQEGSRKALLRLRNLARSLYEEHGKCEQPGRKAQDFEEEFQRAIRSDLNLPKALATVWKMIRSDLDGGEKVYLLRRWDSVLGLNLFEIEETVEEAVDDGLLKAREIAEKRELARKIRDYQSADKMRTEIESMGFRVIDLKDGYRLEKMK
jgi:cysteinyl-tRNA synthetase